MFKCKGSPEPEPEGFPNPPDFLFNPGAGATQKKVRPWPILILEGISSVWKKTLDPQKRFLQQWNKIFVLSCVIAVAVDPLFFYIPVFDRKHQCLTIDRPLMIVACVLRSFIDIFYVLHMIFEFRTGFQPSSLTTFRSPDLIEGRKSIAKRYLFSNFTIDILSIVPLPQFLVLVLVPSLRGSTPLKIKNFVKIAVLLQYIPRLLRIYPLYKEVTRTSGILTERAWSGAAFNLLIYMQASHVVGALWYLFSVEQEARCWLEACKKSNCTCNFMYCGDHNRQACPFIYTYCPYKESEDDNAFKFGMYVEARKFRLTETTSFRRKFIYSFWWALRNVGSGGQNLEVSDYMGEVLFAVVIAILGLVLFALLISNIQKYLQSSTVRVEQMRIERRDAENWMAQRRLPKNLRRRIRRYDQYKWQLNRGVKEEELINNFPMDIRRDIKRHLHIKACSAILKRVPFFQSMDNQLLNIMYEHIKPVLFTEDSILLEHGDQIVMMLFVVKGKLVATIYLNNTSYKVGLEAGDFYGEEIIPWAMDPYPNPIPISTKTIKSLTKVEAFALEANHLRSVTSEFYIHCLDSKHWRFHSSKWRVWAAYKIQEVWRKYCERKKMGGGDGRFKDVLAKTVGISASFNVNLYASIFISHLLKAARRDQQQILPNFLLAMMQPPPPNPGAQNEQNYTILNL